MRRATRVILGAAIIGGIALIAAPAGAAPGPAPAAAPAVQAVQAAANTPAQYGFAFADLPTATLYAANPRMSANSTGAVNTVRRNGTGNYTVRMPGLGATDGGNVQVSAYGDHANRCKASGWHATGVAMEIGVVCHTSSGGQADTQFTVQFHRGTNNPAHQSAYLYYGQASGLDPVFSFNSKGGSNAVTKLGTGRYQVNFGAGFTRLSGVVNVTAVGWDGDFCKVRGWGRTTADVRCYTAAGQLSDTSWSLRYVDQHLPNGFAELGGYVWANDHDASLGQWYVPDERHNFSMQSLAERNEVRRVATGRYEVLLPRIPAFDAGNPVVTGHYYDGISCKVTELVSSGSSAKVKVDCRNAAGVLRDSMFTLTHVTNL